MRASPVVRPTQGVPLRKAVSVALWAQTWPGQTLLNDIWVIHWPD